MVNAYGLLTGGGRGSKIPIFVLTSFENGPIKIWFLIGSSNNLELKRLMENNVLRNSPHEFWTETFIKRKILSL